MLRRLSPAIALALLALPAAAQPGPPGGAGRLFISPAGEPFRGGGGLEAWFARADADHDGTLILAEFRAGHLGAEGGVRHAFGNGCHSCSLALMAFSLVEPIRE